MAYSLNDIWHSFKNKGGIFMFIRAQLSSQVATLSDFAVTIILAMLFSVYYVYATFIGALFGGIINCIVNYKWTFKSNCRKTDVFFKYIIVWIGSILLNTWGTFALTEAIRKNIWVQELLKRYVDDLFIFSKIVVAFIVLLVWNYNMQRLFVYKDSRTFKLLLKKTNNNIEQENGNI